MELTLGLLADYANKSADGKLNILGVFSQVYSQQYPALHPEMKLVLRMEMHPAEAGQTKQMQIQFRSADGQTLFEVAGDLSIEAPPSPVGEMLMVDTILGLNNFPLEAPGTYEFVVMVNGEVKGTVPLKAMVVPEQRTLPK